MFLSGIHAHNNGSPIRCPGKFLRQGFRELQLKAEILMGTEKDSDKMTSAIKMHGTNSALPIRFFLTADMLPDEKTKAQLLNLATSKELRHYVAVLPDIHHKSRNLSPTGSVVVSKEHILPRAIDNGINCGMRIMSTDIQISD